MSSPKLLTIEEVSSRLRVPKGYIYRLNYEGRIPGLVKLGHRTLRYNAQILEEWIEKGCPASQESRPGD